MHTSINLSPPAKLNMPQRAPLSQITGAEAALEALRACGVDTVFGYPGGAVLPLYDALHGDIGLRHVLVRHEQAAVHAAEGYARSTGRLGVVFVTSGPGVANTISGLLDAMSDSIPVLCISGQVATEKIGTQAFQECDALGISSPVTKWSHQISCVDEIADSVVRAVRLAQNGRPGPVLLDFPKDIQAQTLDWPGSWVVNLETPLEAISPEQTPTDAALQEAAELIASAKRPVFYGGGGLISSGHMSCNFFADLVHMTGAPCTLTLMGLGAFPASDPLFVGMLGMHGTLEANLAMHHSDLVVCVGARFDDRITGELSSFCPSARFIHININPMAIDHVVKTDVPLAGDCASVLSRLLPRVQALGRTDLHDWWWSINHWRQKDSLDFQTQIDDIVPQQLMVALAEQLRGRDAIVSTDVGQHQMWAAQYLPMEAPGRWLTSGGAGTMGYGLPAAIGAQVAHPERLVVCVSGDASVLMNIQELSTAVQHRCSVKLIICNNACMGMVRQWQQLHHGGRYSHSYTEALPDFVALAQAFGWQSARVSHPANLNDALAVCMASDGPYLLDVRVAQQENCFPMIPAGKGHHEVMLSADRIWSEDLQAPV
jgi:acetolactate synthase-1/2/3 large subunit